MVVNVTQKDFQNHIKDGFVLVDFWSPCCPPCKALGIVLDNLSRELGIKVVKVNADGDLGLAERYGVRGLPTMIFMNNGNEVHRIVGYQDQSSLKEVIQKLNH
ncbi:thioredoxin [Marinithermofilum abyssi]|jgi:thioredoxin 1|uniref:Thioredoxin n=1 Tax=Marinithermofilum abyssi TaxID=1571185 RepID=A0A8J2VEZ7_9BACL|nr:thioredoxin domain-containing protein [Marinithermofilum abyssi]GGE27936.1 thioredoxin [Marinithermofilum abyssi]